MYKMVEIHAAGGRLERADPVGARISFLLSVSLWFTGNKLRAIFVGPAGPLDPRRRRHRPAPGELS